MMPSCAVTSVVIAVLPTGSPIEALAEPLATAAPLIITVAAG